MFVLAAALLCAVVPAVVLLRAPPAASLCVVAPALVLPPALASAPRSVRPSFGADVFGWGEVMAACWSLLLASWSKGGMRKAAAVVWLAGSHAVTSGRAASRASATPPAA